MAVVAQDKREQLEVEFWQTAEHEGRGVFSMFNILNKMGEMPTFVAELKRFAPDITAAQAVLELGGGELWGSCILKALHPDRSIVGSDISDAAIASAPIWEDIFRVQLDGKLACSSYSIPLDDESQDLVFAFQAAHHFGDHERTFREVARVLRPSGVLLYLGEPVCSKLFYRTALKRVNAMRPEVHEDLLVLSEMRRLAAVNGLSMTAVPRSEMIHPTLRKSLYYAGLHAVPALRRVLPNAMSLRFTKTGA